MEQTKPKVKLVEKRVKFTSLEEIVRLQFVLYSFTNNVHLTPGDYNLLVHVAINGYHRSSTPKELVEKRIFLHAQSVRNTRIKLCGQGLLVKKTKTSYDIDPKLQIERSGHILVDLKAINV